MVKGFNVTYEIVTPESAEAGDAAKRGFVAENVSLRDAIWETGRNRFCRGSFTNCGRWLTCSDDVDYPTGAVRTFGIHPPNTITAASYKRIVQLLTGAKE